MTGINTSSTNLKTFAQMQNAGFQPTGTPVTTSALQYISNTPLPNSNAQNLNSLEKTPKKDVFTIGKKEISKKKALTFAGLAAAAVAAGVGIFLASRGKLPSGENLPPLEILNTNQPNRIQINDQTDICALSTDFQKIARDMTARACNLFENAQKKITEATQLYKNGGKDVDGKVVAKISYNPTRDFEQTMEETLNSGGITLRRSVFVDDLPQTIIEILESGEENVITLQKGRLVSYKEGVQTLEGGIDKIAREITARNGVLDSYREGIEKLPDQKQTVRTARCLSLISGRPLAYMENSETRLADSSKSVATRVGFDENWVPECIITGLQETANGNKTVENNLQLINGHWTEMFD